MRKSFFFNEKGIIGLQGFEPWTSPTRTARSTKLSHNPNNPPLHWRGGRSLCHGRDRGGKPRLVLFVKTILSLFGKRA